MLGSHRCHKSSNPSIASSPCQEWATGRAITDVRERPFEVVCGDGVGDDDDGDDNVRVDDGELALALNAAGIGGGEPAGGGGGGGSLPFLAVLPVPWDAPSSEKRRSWSLWWSSFTASFESSPPG